MIYTIIRLLLGGVFIFSGWVKAIDPVGSSYKISEYISTFNMEWLESLAMPLSILLSAFELALGIMLFFNLWKKTISYLTFLFMLGFTVVTLFLVAIPDIGITECGCFGDAWVLTNGETFVKNLILLSLALLLARRNFILGLNRSSSYYTPRQMSGSDRIHLKGFRFIVYLYIGLFALSVPIYSAMYLPPYTYLPFDIGTNLRGDSNNSSVEDVVTKLIYKNRATGEEKTFDVEDTEWQDDTKWEYVDTKTEGGGKELSSMALSIYDAQKNNVTTDLINNDGFTFFVIAQDISEMNYSDFEKLNGLHNLSTKGGAKTILLTASDLTTTHNKIASNGWQDVKAYNVDLVVLKSFLRNEKGVVLVNNGVISGKWNLRSPILQSGDQNEINSLISWERNLIYIYFAFIGILVAIMLYLVVLFHKIKR